jgi:hypothetical protein
MTLALLSKPVKMRAGKNKAKKKLRKITRSVLPTIFSNIRKAIQFSIHTVLSYKRLKSLTTFKIFH